MKVKFHEFVKVMEHKFLFMILVIYSNGVDITLKKTRMNSLTDN